MRLWKELTNKAVVEALDVCPGEGPLLCAGRQAVKGNVGLLPPPGH